MNEVPIVLHVGAPKAGSSALQHDLTRAPLRPLHGGPATACEYVAIDATGRLLRGDDLDAFAALYAARYAASAAIDDLLALPADRLARAAAALAAMRGAGIAPVISYELWLHADPAAVHRFTAALGGPLHVVAYVRDPVSWLRSLYWQRRRPEPLPIAAWIAEKAALCCWDGHVAAWRSAPNVARVDVRLADDSVPADFARVVGFAPSPADVRHNASMPGEFARFVERHPISPTLSVSEARFAWARWTAAAGVRGPFAPTPALFGEPELRAIVGRTAPSSAALLPHCDEDVRSRIVADARWWSSDPEVHGASAAAAATRPPEKESDALVDAGLAALVAADAAWRAEERSRRVAEGQRDRAEMERNAALAALDAARREIEHLSGPAAARPPRHAPLGFLRRLWRKAA